MTENTEAPRDGYECTWPDCPWCAAIVALEEPDPGDD